MFIIVVPILIFIIRDQTYKVINIIFNYCNFMFVKIIINRKRIYLCSKHRFKVLGRTASLRKVKGIKNAYSTTYFFSECPVSFIE